MASRSETRSPAPDAVSLRSDQSMGPPIVFKGGTSYGNPSLSRGPSPDPVSVSVGSDQSTSHRLQVFKDGRYCLSPVLCKPKLSTPTVPIRHTLSTRLFTTTTTAVSVHKVKES
ncbi:hypothetical protein WMY93_011727 [Mugilogobius chulae]|uniref:Uncharacterized protein n=1 Tax=Mugilogobius chulae TaxID=88201 RepID=A0AAW0P973_9GOBI